MPIPIDLPACAAAHACVIEVQTLPPEVAHDIRQVDRDEPDRQSSGLFSGPRGVPPTSSDFVALSGLRVAPLLFETDSSFDEGCSGLQPGSVETSLAHSVQEIIAFGAYWRKDKWGRAVQRDQGEAYGLWCCRGLKDDELGVLPLHGPAEARATVPSALIAKLARPKVRTPTLGLMHLPKHETDSAPPAFFQVAVGDEAAAGAFHSFQV